jgi:hypothetical protein
MKGLFTGTRADGSAVNGWYGDQYTNAIEKDANGDILYDVNGVPSL